MAIFGGRREPKGGNLGPDDIERFREERRKAFDQPCTKCGTAPVHIVFKDGALCTECYLAGLKERRKKLLESDFRVGSNVPV